ncbi:MAG: molybdopterin-dependent oxidoreductase, partial [Chloroflexi bacterium]|nr:molybdopterin-dependent oxidoreductase [Chloroflexota bacterium]
MGVNGDAEVAVTRLSGRGVRRVEDPRLLRGAGRFVEDLQPAGVMYLAFVRSPYPAARVVSIDVAAARGLSGVVAVITGEDLRGVGDVPTIPLPFAKVPPFPPLSRGRVATVGDPIVAILADTADLARDAADLVQVEFDPQPSIASAEAALEPGAPVVHPELGSNLCYTLTREGGDVGRAFAEADTVVSLAVDSPRVAPIPLEPRGIVAVPGAAGSGPRLTIWVSSQAPHGVKHDVARALDLDPAELR